jgi:hypothetical protein
MVAATAEYRFSEIRLLNPLTSLLQFRSAEPKAEPPLQGPRYPQLSDIHLGALTGPTPIPAEWLPIVERRIRDSLVPYGIEHVNDGYWLNLEVGRRALRFFEATSDVLPPSEPYIYSSANADLVAEFKDSHGSLTTIIGPTFTIAFAVIGREIVKEELQPRRIDDMAPEREMLQRLIRKMRTSQNGAVEPKKH